MSAAVRPFSKPHKHAPEPKPWAKSRNCLSPFIIFFRTVVVYELNLHTLLLLPPLSPPPCRYRASCLWVSAGHAAVGAVRPAVSLAVVRSPQLVSSHSYQNNNNNMDGLSSDFTSASPFIAPVQLHWPRFHEFVVNSTRTLWNSWRTESTPTDGHDRPAFDTLRSTDTSGSCSAFCLLAGKGGGAFVTSLLREKARVLDLF